MDMEKSWYAVYTRAKCENIVYQDLSSYCEAYYPKQIVNKRWSDRNKKMTVPLLPSYVFAFITEQQRFHIYRNPKVVNILSRNGKIIPIVEKEMESIRRIEVSRLPFQFTQHQYTFAAGDKILFNNGPLYGIEGWVDRLMNNSNVYVRIPSLGGYFVADIKNLSPESNEIKEIPQVISQGLQSK